MNGFKKARLEEGLTQAELAEILGVSTVAVCKWETGKGLPKVKRLKFVAKTLNTTVAKLIDEERVG